MPRKTKGFNLTETIRQYRTAHAGQSARDAFVGIKKAHSGEKINEGTFRSTFYKLTGSGKRKVKRRKPGRLVPGHRSADHLMSVGLQFIRLAGGVEEAGQRLVGLAELIETAREVE
jgi:hypothetical protein